MTTALLFPGQGTDLAESVRAWRAHSQHVRQLLDIAAVAVHEPADALQSPVALAHTAIAQAALTALGIGIALELEELGIVAAAVAGHSAGEVAACAAAGAIAPDDAVQLAAERGRLMAREAAKRPGGMLSVRASDAELALMLAVSEEGRHVGLAAHNAPDEWVLSGDLAALRAVATRWPASPVPTAGAWHSPALAGARDEYERALRKAVRHPVLVPVICNRTGEAVHDADALPGLLAGQLTHPVRWAESMQTLATMGVRCLIACGPGRALRRFARAALPDARFMDLSSPAPLADLIAASTG